MTTPQNRRRAGLPDGRSDLEPLRLLVVDDDPHYRAYIVALTQRQGFIVHESADGAEAVAQLARLAYDVAIIDLEMPRVNGLEVITRVRQTESNLFALMLTGHENSETMLEALEAGFDDFLSKSSPEAELVAKLESARRLASRQRMLDTRLRELYGIATRDELTGVFNRRFFMEESARQLAAGTPLTIVLFDVDDFKDINDSYGHLAGDRVLQDVAAVLHRHTRSDDLIARYGGDEFVMVMPRIEGADCEKLAARLANAVHALRWSAAEESFAVTVSTGVASSPLLEEASVELLLNAADRDLYKNKWIRKNPGVRPDLYEYPRDDQKIDVIVPLPQPESEPAAAPPAVDPPVKRIDVT